MASTGADHAARLVESSRLLLAASALTPEEELLEWTLTGTSASFWNARAGAAVTSRATSNINAGNTLAACGALMQSLQMEAAVDEFVMLRARAGQLVSW